MKKTLLPIALLGACAGFALRKLQLAKSYDAAGLIPRGDKISLALYLICALAAVLILVLCLRQRKGAHCEAKSSNFRGVLVILGALGLLASHMPPALEGGMKLVLLVLVFASACAMTVEGLCHMRGERTSLLGGCILPIYLAVTLISEYRTWSHDPLVADFCFPLLFLVAAMLASYHLAAFRVGRGKRRTTAFLVGCALLCAGPVLVDGDWRTVVRTLAISIYLIAELWPYLGKPVPIEETKAAEDKEQAPEAEEKTDVPAEKTVEESIEELLNAPLDDEPETVEAPASEPEAIPDAEPEPIEAPASEPEAIPDTEPEPVEAPASEPEVIPDAEPEAVEAPVSESEAIPEAEPEAIEAPESEPEAIPDAEPEAVEAPANEPETIPDTEPEAIEAPASEPEATTDEEPKTEE